MATSPIYGWLEPDNTDLVKNGALAIRTLGNAIDTTMATMTPKSLVDAKGDLIAATANDTPARLAVGATNTFLRPNASAATGLEWVDGATTWTPTYTNITIGNGTVTAKYVRVGKIVTAFFSLAFGSTTAITANYARFTLPVAAASNFCSGWGQYEDAGTGNGFMGFYVAGFDCYPTRAITGLWNGIDATNPITWTTNDKLSFLLKYQVA